MRVHVLVGFAGMDLAFGFGVQEFTSGGRIDSVEVRLELVVDVVEVDVDVVDVEEDVVVVEVVTD